MCGIPILLAIGIVAFRIGLSGFSPEGMQLTRKTNITGPVAKVIGAICMIFSAAAVILTLILASRFGQGK